MEMLDSNDPLIVLADNYPWSKLENYVQQFYTGIGRPPKPIRLMVGLLLLKQLENLSDENIVLQFKRNPYYQYFCGRSDYKPEEPCHSTELVKFRNRIGKEGFEYIFKLSVEMHGGAAEESQIIIDSTVQESNLTFPTDGKLALKIIIHLMRIAKKESIKLRRSYVKELKKLRIQLRFYRHPRKIKTALGAMKRIRAIAKILMRDIQSKMDDEALKSYQSKFDFYLKVLSQKRNDKNKVYSLHEVDAYAINKGKDHKGYEFGTKASIAITKESGIIVGAVAHPHIHDSKTLPSVLDNVHKNRTTPVKEAICDRGYIGIKRVSNNYDALEYTLHFMLFFISLQKNYFLILTYLKAIEMIPIAYTTTISLPSTIRKKDTPKELEIKRQKFRRRAAIEPIIGHLKSDHRMARNYLKGFKGDEVNLLLAASAFNLKKWMRLYFFALFIGNISLVNLSLELIERELLLLKKFYLKL
jgi:IS5 family transposase